MLAACVDSSLQLSISAETIHTTVRVQNMNPCPSPSPKLGKMPIRVAALAFDLFCSVLSQPMYPIVPSPLKRRQRVTASLREHHRMLSGGRDPAKARRPC